MKQFENWKKLYKDSTQHELNNIDKQIITDWITSYYEHQVNILV